MTQHLEINDVSVVNVPNATAWVAEVTAACNSLSMERIMDLFTEDVVADRGFAVLVGRPQVEAYMRPVYARYTHYELTKTLRAIDGDQIIVDARLKWKTPDHARMQHTRALEILKVRNWKICRWDNAAISWEEEGAGFSESHQEPVAV
ncbi:hypothetical protein GmRootV213_50160 (plasmid) [Variovorax sp. V213]|uniref:nuclear transport factor 2 family protein n=1 Tax=Variovorax sp. V213 TaxID=3065955 RepID=UPI0034E8A502